MGLPELIIVLLFIGLPIWALVDVSRRHESSFAAQGRNKNLWMVLLILGIFVTPVGAIAAVIYLFAVRPKLGT